MDLLFSRKAEVVRLKKIFFDPDFQKNCLGTWDENEIIETIQEFNSCPPDSENGNRERMARRIIRSNLIKTIIFNSKCFETGRMENGEIVLFKKETDPKRIELKDIKGFFLIKNDHDGFIACLFPRRDYF